MKKYGAISIVVQLRERGWLDEKLGQMPNYYPHFSTT
jgi:hypothetical protein